MGSSCLDDMKHGAGGRKDVEGGRNNTDATMIRRKESEGIYGARRVGLGLPFWCRARVE